MSGGTGLSKTWTTLTLLHLERPKLDGVLAVLSAVGLIQKKYNSSSRQDTYLADSRRIG